MSVSEKVKCINGNDKNLSISRQCELLQLPCFSYYRPRYYQVEDEENLELLKLIDEEFLGYPFYGSGKRKVYLNLRGFPLNRKRFQRLMRLMGLESVASKPNTSRQRKGHQMYPYLLKKMSITEHDHVWCSDITYIRQENDFVYLTAVMNWASRYVLSWGVSVTLG